MGTGQPIDEVYSPRQDIYRGIDWYDGTGFTIVADEDISALTFSIVFKRGEQTILTLTESNALIVHSGVNTLRLKVPAAINESLSVGPIRGNLVAGTERFMGTIETYIR
jgi:hypothetical protein